MMVQSYGFLDIQEEPQIYINAAKVVESKKILFAGKQISLKELM